MSYTVWDVETTIRSSFKRKGNPFDPDNYVVMSGYARKGGDVHGDYFGRAGKPGGPGLPDDWFIKLLEGTTLLVGQNIKYDILYALMDSKNREANRKAWMAWVAAGGNVWDCQLAEYLLDGMDPASHMLSMDELAPRYGGNTKFDEVKALWQAGVSTEDINPDLLRRYLCGTRYWNADEGHPEGGYWTGEHGDIVNTEVIFLGQLERARACGQVKSILLNMGSLLCTIEMELNGMAVDVALGKEQAAELEARLAELSVELASYLPADLPFDFNWGSTVQKSAIIFGGKVKYQKWVQHTDPNTGAPLYAMKDEVHGVLIGGGTHPIDAMGIGEGLRCGSEFERYKGGKNAGEFKTKKVKVPDLSKPKGAQKDHWYEFPGYTKPKDKWQGKKEGVYSTSADVIAELGNKGIPFLDSLAKVTALSKDLTTYYIVTDPDTGESKGMLTLVQADGIIHHMLNHTSTVTARFSSSNPNLQNLPKEGKSVVKSLFVSRFKNGKIIQSDFTALEVYVQAILTRCAQLIEDLKQGLDMHCVRVSQAHGIPYEEAYRLAVVEKVKEWSAKRTKAKIFSFQRAYGAGAALIAESTGMAREEVDALIDAENERYPEIEKFYTDEATGLMAILKENRSPTHRFCQHPEVPGLTCNLGKSWYRTPDNKLYTWRENPAPKFLAERPASRGGTPQSFSPTEVKNYPVQGTGGEWAKAAMWLAIRAFYARGNFGGLALLVNQVHDALYVDADDSVAVEAAALLHACMEEASTFMEWYFSWTIPVPVPSETMMGANMMDEQRPPEPFASNVVQFKREIRSRYIGNYTPHHEAAQPQTLAA